MKYDELISKSLTELYNPLPYIITKVFDEIQKDEAGNDVSVKYAEYIDLGVCPASYSCALKELLSSDSGRTEDTTYNKMRLGKYLGETSVPLYNGKLGFWDSFSLTLSQRKADTYEVLKEASQSGETLDTEEV